MRMLKNALKTVGGGVCPSCLDVGRRGGGVHGIHRHLRHGRVR